MLNPLSLSTGSHLPNWQLGTSLLFSFFCWDSSSFIVLFHCHNTLLQLSLYYFTPPHSHSPTLQLHKMPHLYIPYRWHFSYTFHSSCNRPILHFTPTYKLTNNLLMIECMLLYTSTCPFSGHSLSLSQPYSMNAPISFYLKGRAILLQYTSFDSLTTHHCTQSTDIAHYSPFFPHHKI